MPRQYEKITKGIVEEVTKALPNLKKAVINQGRKNKIEGASGFRHQIDVSIEMPSEKLILIECKSELGDVYDFMLYSAVSCHYGNRHAKKSQNRCGRCDSSHHHSWNRTQKDISQRFRPKQLRRAAWKNSLGYAYRMLSLGSYPKSCAFVVANRFGAHFDCYAQAFDRIRCFIQPQIPPSRAVISKPIQIHFVPGRSVFEGVGPLHSFKPTASRLDIWYESFGQIPMVRSQRYNG